MPLTEFLSQIEKEVQEKEAVKDEVYKAMREAIHTSKQAIFSTHKRKFEEARKLLMRARRLFAKLDEIPSAHRDVAYSGLVDAAYQEFTEAHLFLKIALDKRLVGPKKIKVPSTSYLLGLADVVGELRRLTLDSLRKGDLKAAENSLETMEIIYDGIMSMDEALHVVGELRRKSDIARRIIEATRGDVTAEARKHSLERSIEKLEKIAREYRR
ncbi:MAG: hypothetical protein JSV64_06840 [Candidatus Bathyarchaeota archaeon]|nr:MAG: hypothetical protein JSV64_06840 [Candidatus Bathyarchaeota archaeon]